MKIWLLSSEFPPNFGGGIGTYADHTARMYAEAGHEITVITKDESLEDEALSISDGPVRVIRFKPGRSQASKCLGNYVQWSYDLAVAAAEAISSDGAPDIIECQEYLGLAYFLLQRRWTLDPIFEKVPVVLTLHAPQFICDRYNQNSIYSFPVYWLGEMEKYCIRAADAVISPSRFLLTEINKVFDLSEVEKITIPNPYSPDPNDLIEPEANTPNLEQSLLYIGRLERRKGVLKLLEYLEKVWKHGTEIPLILLGGDCYYYPYNTWMRELIQNRYQKFIEQGLLQLRDPVPAKEVQKILKRARLLVVPSIFENFPYTVLEPMALGTPILCSTSGGQAEIVEDGISGFKFSHENPDEFGDKLLQAWNLNAAERGTIGGNARQRVKDLCSYESVYPHKIQFLERTIERNSSKRLFPIVRGRQRIAPSNHKKITSNLLSVVIPFYNLGNYLEETLTSITRINDLEIEIIVVDDGSNDPNSIQIIEALKGQFAFKLIRQDNLGLASARNTGAKEAMGEYLAFLDADDTVEPEYYPRAVKILKSFANVSFVGCWSHYWDKAEGYWPAWNPEPPYLLVHNTAPSGSMVYRKSDFIEYGLNDPELEYGMEDYESMLRLVEHGCRGVVIPEPYLNYRVRLDSMMHHLIPNKAIFTYQRIAEKHPDFYREYGDEIACLLNANGPGYLYDNPTVYLPQIGFLPPASPPPENLEEQDRIVVPNLSASAFFYFGMRKALLPLYLRLGERNMQRLGKFKDQVKSIIVKDEAA